MIKYNKVKYYYKIKAYYGLSKLTEKQMYKKNASPYIISNISNKPFRIKRVLFKKYARL
jgi:hypothetical protein